MRKIKAEDLFLQENKKEDIEYIKQHAEKYTEYNIEKIQKLTGERDIEIIGDILKNTAIIMEAKRGKTIYAKLEINGNIKEEAVILSQGPVEVFNEEKGSCVIEKGAIIIAQNGSSIRVDGRVKEIAVIATQGNFEATAVNDGAIIDVPEENIRIDHDKRQKPEASGYDHVNNMQIGDNYTYDNVDPDFEILKMPTPEFHIYNSDIKKAYENKSPQDSTNYIVGDKKVSREEFIKITGISSPEQPFKDHNFPKPEYHFHDEKQPSDSDIEDVDVQPHKRHSKEK